MRLPLIRSVPVAFLSNSISPMVLDPNSRVPVALDRARAPSHSSASLTSRKISSARIRFLLLVSSSSVPE